jgi:hypothetical protein
MDDLELEARLRTHLHRRFDDAPLPAGLASNVSQSLATAARPVGFATRTGRIRLGWAAVAAAVVIAVGAIGIGKGLWPTGPGAVATPTAHATEAPDREFIVLPPDGTVLNKPEASLAGDVLSARIRALGIATFSWGGGYGIQFTLPATGPSDASIRAVLGATGDVRIVPLPAVDYGAGKLTATLGKPLPKDEPPLFGWDGITSFTSVALGTFDGSVHGAPLLAMTPKAIAAQTLASYGSSDPDGRYAIVVDGLVALVPTARDWAADGSINISNGEVPGGSEPTAAYYETAAILVGGELPDAWRGASVPVLVPRDNAIAAALTATHGGTVRDASPTVDLVPGGAFQAVWSIAVFQPDCQDTGSCVSSDLLVRVDAVTGTVIDVGPMGK